MNNLPISAIWVPSFTNVNNKRWLFLDIRDLISVDDVMEELNLGPNGALVYCMEYLMENFEWLNE